MLDTIDKKLINLLQVDSKQTTKQLSLQLNLSITAIYERIKKLENQNVIEKYVAIVNKNKIDKSFLVFCHVKLIQHSKEYVHTFENEILKLEQSSTNWLKFFKLIAEQEYIKMEKRVFLLQKESAEKKYKDLLLNQPEYLQSIPLNFLSSYLGITQRHLSRIRKAITN